MYNRLQEKKDETCSKEQVMAVQEIMQNEEQYDKTLSSYVTPLSDIIDAEPSRYEEVSKKKGKEI